MSQSNVRICRQVERGTELDQLHIGDWFLFDEQLFIVVEQDGTSINMAKPGELRELSPVTLVEVVDVEITHRPHKKQKDGSK